MITVNTHNARETEALGAKIAEKLCGTEVIALFGGLGMGKTAFTRGLAGALGAGENVSSPTFALVNEYSGKYNIFHFDMYRVNTWDDLYSTGFFDYIDNGIIIIEWSENIEEALPADCIKIRISKGEMMMTEFLKLKVLIRNENSCNRYKRHSCVNRNL